VRIRRVSGIDGPAGRAGSGVAAGREARNKLTATTLSALTDEGTAPQTGTAFALQTLPALTTRPDQIKPLRQTILNLAVRGKLVPQDPADGSSLENSEPFNWARKEGCGFIQDVSLILNVADSHIFASARGRTGATFAHWQIAIVCAKYLSPEFHMW
jgi:hypothetical protein